jgi:REP element-mobilizing transposase RayT
MKKRAYGKIQLPLWSVTPDGRGLLRNALPKSKSAHGGSLGAGKRKGKRPLSFKRPMHLVLRSEKARGQLSLLRHATRVDALLKQQAARHHVKVLHFVNVGNHLHLKVRAYSRESFGAFLKSFTALVARRITGARKGHSFGKFWDALAFTRVLSSRFEERILSRYFAANGLEAQHGTQVREIFLGKDPLSAVLGYG